MNLQTIRGYRFDEVSSVMQKAVRRGDAKLAGYFAHELFASGFSHYVWKRLLTISAEDCAGIITQEIKALHDSYLLVNHGVPAKKHRGRIFISKAVIVLCSAPKSRDADHLQCLVYDRNMSVSAAEVASALEAAGDYVPIPDYAYDCHTYRGKSAGKTKADFFREEHKALEPFQPGLFDFLIEE